MFQAGRIELIVGPMFAGKTTELLRRIHREELARRRCILIKYDKDIRYSQDKVSTHDHKMHDAIPCTQLLPALNKCLEYDTVGIDEGQFFPDIVSFAQKLANYGKHVIVAGLDGTYQRKPFGHVLELISKSESITKLKAVCKEFGTSAPFSKRIVSSDQIEYIGGQESYIAASRSTFFNIKTSGKISLTIGPVKSGKTTELLRILNKYQIAGKKVLILRPSSVIDHHSQQMNIETRSIDCLPDIDSMSQYDIIGIDEGQLYDNIADWSDECANLGKLIFVSALESDGYGNAFSSIIELFPRCEKFSKIDSICPITGLPAPFSIKLDSSTFIPVSRLGILTRNSLNIALSAY